MMTSNEAMLTEEFHRQLEELKKLTPGDDQYKSVLDCVAKLEDRLIERARFNFEREEKETQRKNERIDMYIRHGLTVFGFATNVTSAFVMGVMSMNFEREGTFTTEAGKSAIRQLLRFKF